MTAHAPFPARSFPPVGERHPPAAHPAILEAPMLGRRTKPHNVCQRLRLAVEAMPRSSREAMLRGIADNAIIVGAYADASSGGICPMLAAHRNGGRTDLASFARSWDRYTDARTPRLATRREVMTLTSLLESSLVAEDAPADSIASLAKRIRAEREQAAANPAALAEPVPAPVAPELEPPEPRGPRIRIRRLRRRQERDPLQAAGVS